MRVLAIEKLGIIGSTNLFAIRLLIVFRISNSVTFYRAHNHANMTKNNHRIERKTNFNSKKFPRCSYIESPSAFIKVMTPVRTIQHLEQLNFN